VHVIQLYSSNKVRVSSRLGRRVGGAKMKVTGESKWCGMIFSGMEGTVEESMA
jgi:hypothetical protein